MLHVGFHHSGKIGSVRFAQELLALQRIVFVVNIAGQITQDAIAALPEVSQQIIIVGRFRQVLRQKQFSFVCRHEGPLLVRNGMPQCCDAFRRKLTEESVQLIGVI